MFRLGLLLCTFAIAVNGAAIERVLGGSEAPDHKYPYQVAFFRDYASYIKPTFFCSGAIINEYWIVTAAYCFHNRWLGTVIAVTGSNSLSNFSDYYVVGIGEAHPSYDGYYGVNDIYLIKTRHPIEFSDTVQPIRLPVAELPSGQLDAVVSGWGNTAHESLSYDKLQELEVKIQPEEECARLWGVKEKKICTLYKEGQGICQGDAGSPLVYDRYLVGIAAYDDKCLNGYPDIYTRVWPYVPWIQYIIHEFKNAF